MCKSCGCHGNPIVKETIIVEGMTCGNCTAAVEKAVLGLPGVMAAKADVASKNVKVEYDRQKTAAEEIVQAINAIGFEASPEPVSFIGKIKAAVHSITH